MKKIAVTAGCFLILCFAAVFFFSSNKQPNNTENAAQVQKEEMPAGQSFVIKGHNGNVAVFEEGSDKPFRTTTVAIDELPPADRELLTEGIQASSQEELNLILEDYCS